MKGASTVHSLVCVVLYLLALLLGFDERISKKGKRCLDNPYERRVDRLVGESTTFVRFVGYFTFNNATRRCYVRTF